MAGQFVRPFSFAQILKIIIYDNFTHVMFRSVTPPNQQAVRSTYYLELIPPYRSFFKIGFIKFSSAVLFLRKIADKKTEEIGVYNGSNSECN